jgi:type III secretion system IpaD/SipD/SspD family effector
MNETISLSQRLAPLPAPSHNNLPAGTISTEVAEESEGEWALKLKRAQESVKGCEILNTKATKLVASLQRELKDPLGQRSTVGPVAQDDALTTLFAEWQENSQQSAFASRDLADAIGQVMSPTGFGMPMDALEESHRDFFDRLAEAMRDLDENWLANYEDALARYIEFFTEFNNIMAELQAHIKASDDGQKVEVDLGSLRSRLEALVSEYSRTDRGLAYFSSQAEAQKFIDDLGLAGLGLVQTADGYMVTLDTGPVSDLIDSMPTSNTTWDMARYNAWLSGKDSYTEQLQHVSKVLGEKYSRNLQLLDTLIKVLSSSIDSIGEADRTFVNNF